VEEIRRTARPWVLMEICGGRTHAILRYGLTSCFRRKSSSPWTGMSSLRYSVGDRQALALLPNEVIFILRGYAAFWFK
jgi:hypothetical protein